MSPPKVLDAQIHWIINTGHIFRWKEDTACNNNGQVLELFCRHISGCLGMVFIVQVELETDQLLINSDFTVETRCPCSRLISLNPCHLPLSASIPVCFHPSLVSKLSHTVRFPRARGFIAPQWGFNFEDRICHECWFWRSTTLQY